MLLPNTATTGAIPIWELLCIGAGGALAIQLLLLLEINKLPPENRPNYKKFIYYWPYIINPLIGAFLVFVYALSKDYSMSPWLSLHVGVSAPLILRGLATTVPELPTKLHKPS